MLKNAVIMLLVALLWCSLAFSTPPHPDLLKKIESGEVERPFFFDDPGYFARNGINVGVAESPLKGNVTRTNLNLLTILVYFSDNGQSTPPTDWDNLMYNSFAPSNVWSYWNEVSYTNLMLVTVDFPGNVGWNLAPSPYSYYTNGQYSMGPYPQNSQKLCEDLVIALDPFINFANYDNDGDGIVDGIIIVHAGQEAAITSNPWQIWSHMWGCQNPPFLDGVWISPYAVVPEYINTVGDISTSWGVYCHEMGHLFGCPDFYDTTPSPTPDSYGLGNWSLMAYGSWNGPSGFGGSPAHPDPWCRNTMGFLIGGYINITADQGLSFPPVQNSASVFRLWTNGNIGNEYFLVENRGQIGFDSFLPGNGLLIYHVDETQPNNDNRWIPGIGAPGAPHYRVALEQYDGLFHLENYNNAGDVNDPFPNIYSVLTNFDSNPTPYPNSQDYNYGTTDVRVLNIQQSGINPSDMVANVYVQSQVPILFDPPDGMAINWPYWPFDWILFPGATQYHIQIDNNNDFSSPVINDNTVTVPPYTPGVPISPDGNFYWRVRAWTGSSWTSWSDVWEFFMDTQLPYGSVASSPDTAGSSFTVSWTAGSDPPPSSGVVAYDIHMKDSHTPNWLVWWPYYTGLSAQFTGGQHGHTYYFEAAARDSAGNSEIYYLVGECSTYVDTTLSGYPYLPGDVNMALGIWPPTVIGGDVTYLVGYFIGGGQAACMLDDFWCSADINGDCSIIGGDVTALVGYFVAGGALVPCPDYESAWLEGIPDIQPAGWPNCDTPLINSRVIPTNSVK